MKQKVNPDDYHIEFRWERFVGSDRLIFFRIKPSEIPFLKRLFCNPWHPVKYALGDDWGKIFGVNQFMTQIKPLKTIGDIKAYQKSQWEIIKRNRGQYYEWPKDLNE